MTRSLTMCVGMDLNKSIILVVVVGTRPQDALMMFWLLSVQGSFLYYVDYEGRSRKRAPNLKFVISLRYTIRAI